MIASYDSIDFNTGLRSPILIEGGADNLKGNDYHENSFVNLVALGFKKPEHYVVKI